MATGAIVARILTKYSDKGTKAAIKDIGKMEKKFGDFANKSAKAFGLAALAAGAFAVKVGFDAVKAATEDQKSQTLLANSLRNTVGATDAAIAATEQYVTAMQAEFGVADDDLRPALARLAAVTGSVGKAQSLLGVAMDISAAKSIDLKVASALVAKGYGGNIGALKKLFPQISAATVKSKDFAAALKEISSETEGAAAAAAGTFAGQINRVRLAFGEASESLGYKLLPQVQAFADLLINKAIPAIQKFVTENGDKIAASFKVAIAYGVAFAKSMYDMFSFVARNIQVFATLGAVIVAAFFGGKVAAAVQALVTGILAIIKVMKALRTVSLASAAATALATGGVSAVAGGVAFAAALVAMGLAAKKFNKDSNKALDSLGKFGVDTKGFTAKAGDYTKGIEGITNSTKGLTDAQKDELAVAKGLKALNKYKLSSKDLKAQDPVTLEAIRKNQVKQAKLGLSSPTISLLASAGHGNIAKNTTANGSNITVNVAGSVVSEGDLVMGIKNGLAVLVRRRAGSQFATL
ncbi:hypothetical protein UFOVP1462_33 [uncultured Caudovirales phage]|uniref:Uncharacterized protein n=1 Tax=uncultured Caudovirales phage TaxID=2100421 RepID=A0A6J5S2Q8_9CAUD|nr:hypothetical protein UFOVP1013_33 [uncultured Caudovirales phage]CAB4202950.1 hypothetical protein UFOVP1364_50 [uncultured Caudovirales phage]CAB4214372.1 hypothetical protein UFOVP1462_33 [uncultured Caudovirales phage]CAB5228812.1 hypothetical protein UFOVP1550_42 [uncultured Caudovirales phage]